MPSSAQGPSAPVNLAVHPAWSESLGNAKLQATPPKGAGKALISYTTLRGIRGDQDSGLPAASLQTQEVSPATVPTGGQSYTLRGSGQGSCWTCSHRTTSQRWGVQYLLGNGPRTHASGHGQEEVSLTQLARALDSPTDETVPLSPKEHEIPHWGLLPGRGSHSRLALSSENWS